MCEVRKVDRERGERACSYESALEAVLVRLLGRRRRDECSSCTREPGSRISANDVSRGSRKQSEKAKVIWSQFSPEVENVNVNVTPLGKPHREQLESQLPEE